MEFKSKFRTLNFSKAFRNNQLKTYRGKIDISEVKLEVRDRYIEMYFRAKLWTPNLKND